MTEAVRTEYYYLSSAQRKYLKTNKFLEDGKCDLAGWQRQYEQHVDSSAKVNYKKELYRQGKPSQLHFAL